MSDSNKDEIVRELTTDCGEPVVQVAEIVAKLEGKQSEQLTPSYEQIDSVLQHIFDNPPVPDAQVQITFLFCPLTPLLMPI